MEVVEDEALETEDMDRYRDFGKIIKRRGPKQNKTLVGNGRVDRVKDAAGKREKGTVSTSGSSRSSQVRCRQVVDEARLITSLEIISNWCQTTDVDLPQQNGASPELRSF